MQQRNKKKLFKNPLLFRTKLCFSLTLSPASGCGAFPSIPQSNTCSSIPPSTPNPKAKLELSTPSFFVRSPTSYGGFLGGGGKRNPVLGRRRRMVVVGPSILRPSECLYGWQKKREGTGGEDQTDLRVNRTGNELVCVPGRHMRREIHRTFKSILT